MKGWIVENVARWLTRLELMRLSECSRAIHKLSKTSCPLRACSDSSTLLACGWKNIAMLDAGHATFDLAAFRTTLTELHLKGPIARASFPRLRTFSVGSYGPRRWVLSEHVVAPNLEHLLIKAGIVSFEKGIAEHFSRLKTLVVYGEAALPVSLGDQSSFLLPETLRKLDILGRDQPLPLLLGWLEQTCGFLEELRVPYWPCLAKFEWPRLTELEIRFKNFSSSYSSSLLDRPLLDLPSLRTLSISLMPSVSAHRVIRLFTSSTVLRVTRLSFNTASTEPPDHWKYDDLTPFENLESLTLSKSHDRPVWNVKLSPSLSETLTELSVGFEIELRPPLRFPRLVVLKIPNLNFFARTFAALPLPQKLRHVTLTLHGLVGYADNALPLTRSRLELDSFVVQTSCYAEMPPPDLAPLVTEIQFKAKPYPPHYFITFLRDAKKLERIRSRPSAAKYIVPLLQQERPDVAFSADLERFRFLPES